MVARRHTIWQGGDSPAALPGWGHADVPSLTAGDMRAFLRQSPRDQRLRLVYAILLIHADAMGFVMVRNAEVAEAAGLKLTAARHLLYELRDRGEILCVRAGKTALPSIWQIAAVGRAA